MKIWPVGTIFFHADGQSDMAKLSDACRKFQNAPIKYNISTSIIILGDQKKLDDQN